MSNAPRQRTDRLTELPISGDNPGSAEPQRRQKIQQATFEISEAAHTAQDLPSLYRHIHKVISGLMPAQNFYIALLDPVTQMISFDYYVDERSPKPAPQPMNTGLTSLVLRTGKALLVGPDIEARKKSVGGEVTFEGLGGASYIECGIPAAVWLGVPLFVQATPIGVVAVQDYRDNHAYTNDEKQILTFVAGQIALAIERKRAVQELRASEARLRESEARFSAAFEASPVFMSISRMSDRRYVLVNEPFLNWTGYARDEVLGRDSVELALWEDPAARDRFWEELHRTRSIRERESRLRNRHGRVFTMLLSADIIEINHVPHLIAVGLDITRLKNAEAELLKTVAREKELGELKSNFVSMVSHEFRTPLGIIQSSAEVLRDYFERLEVAEREDHLRSIIKSTRRMADMMEEILVLSRLDAGKMEFKPSPMDLGMFCRRIVDEVLAATDRRCPIELSLFSISSAAQADEALLAHIFINLLSNAIKYSQDGGTVTLTLEREGPDAVCIIRDHGIGIPPADQDSIFDAFQRGGNVGDRPGTGLGLVLVKRCLELHSGRIQIDSKIGEGTTVTIKLPVFGMNK